MATMTSPNVGPRGLKRTVAPTIKAIELSAFKKHAKVDLADEDDLLLEYIEAATDYVQDEQQRALCLSTWQAVYDCFPSSGVFYVPRPPLAHGVVVETVPQEVEITYLDSSGDEQTLPESYYVVDTISEPGRISLANGQTWPSTLNQPGAVTLTFPAGHTTADEMKASTRQAIRVLAHHWYMHREPIVIGASVQSVPLSVQDMIDQDKFVSYR